MRRSVLALSIAPVLLTLSALSAGSVAPPQAPNASAPRFPSSVEQVVVDVVVLDEGGVAVSGLTREDFEVEEEGANQAVIAFEPVVSLPSPIARTPEAKTSATAPAATVGPTRVEPSHVDTRRTFAIVFDDLSLTRAQGERGIAVLRQLVATGASGNDLVVLATSSGAAGWTARTEADRQDLLALLARQSGRRMADWSAERITDAEAYQIQMQRELDDASGSTFQRVFQRYVQASPPGTSALTIGAMVRANAAAAYDKAARRIESTLSALEGVTRPLDTVRGRKAVVLVSPGFFYAPDLPYYRRVVDACRRANAAIYFLDVAGIEAMPVGLTAAFGSPSPIPSAGAMLPAESYDEATIMSGHYRQARDETAGAVVLANDTGGFVATDLALGLRRVVEDTRAYYLLGYVPANPVADGRFRRIAVRLAPASTAAGRGFTVRARKGYFANGPVAAMPVAAEPERELLAALESPVERREVPVRLSAYVMEDSPAATPGRIRCGVVLETDPDGLSLHEEHGRTLGALDAAFGAEARDGGTAVTPVRKHAQLKLAPETIGELRQRWYALAHDLELAPGVHQLRAAVRDAATGRTGSAWVRLEVPAPGAFRVSTPFVSDAFAADPQGFRHLYPTARREFTVGSPVYLSFDVHGAATDPATGAPAVSMGYRVERPDGGVALEVQPQPIAAARSDRRAFEGTGFDAADTGLPRTAPSVRPPLTAAGAPAPHRFLGFQLDRAEPGEYRVVAQIVDTVSRREISFVEPFRVVAAAEPAAVAASPHEGTAARTSPDPALEALLRLAGAYVVEYERAFGDLVLEEEYRQRSLGGGVAWRRTRADLVFARLPGVIRWGSFRDVYELNGQPVRGRDRRLEALFAQDPAHAVERSDAIVAESARYNIGPDRTVNMPAMPLLFLHPENQPRFVFERRNKPDGETVEVAFRETARPTLVRDRQIARAAEPGPGRDLPAEGRFWLDPKRGTVVRSEVRFRWRALNALATVTTEYRAEPRLAMWVPAEMRERYEGGVVFGGVTEAVALYSTYRRFGVSVQEDVKLPPAP